MFRTVTAALGFVILASAAPVLAADPSDAPVASKSSSAAPLGLDLDWGKIASQSTVTPKRPALLPTLYLGLAGLNAYDAFTTLKGVSNGAKEANGAMKGVAGAPAAMWAVKGGVTAGSIFMAERLWRNGHRAQAVALMVVSNGMMATVAAHNSGVIGAQR